VEKKTCQLNLNAAERYKAGWRCFFV